ALRDTVQQGATTLRFERAAVHVLAQQVAATRREQDAGRLPGRFPSFVRGTWPLSPSGEVAVSVEGLRFVTRKDSLVVDAADLRSVERRNDTHGQVLAIGFVDKGHRHELVLHWSAPRDLSWSRVFSIGSGPGPVEAARLAIERAMEHQRWRAAA